MTPALFCGSCFDSEQLSVKAKEAFREPDNEVYLSAASCWEINVKRSLGRLQLPEDPSMFIPRQRSQHIIEPLPITEAATFHLAKLPEFHMEYPNQ